MAQIKFYSIKDKKNVWVDSSKVTIRTLKNGKKGGEAVDPISGSKLFKFLSNEDKKILGVD